MIRTIIICLTARVLAALICIQKYPKKADLAFIAMIDAIKHNTRYKILQTNAELAIKAIDKYFRQ